MEIEGLIQQRSKKAKKCPDSCCRAWPNLSAALSDLPSKSRLLPSSSNEDIEVNVREREREKEREREMKGKLFPSEEGDFETVGFFTKDGW